LNAPLVDNGGVDSVADPDAVPGQVNPPGTHSARYYASG